MRVVRPVQRGEQRTTDGVPRFACGPAYDVLFMLAAAPHPRRHELARGWGAALQRRLSSEARTTWRTLFGGEAAIGAEPVRLVPRLVPFPAVADLVVLLRRLSPAEFALSFFGDDSANPALIDAITQASRTLTPTPAAQRALAGALAARKPAVRAQLNYLLADIEAVRQSYIALLGEADTRVLALEWPAIEPLLEGTRAAYARRYTGLNAHQVIETLTGLPPALPAAVPGAELVVALSYYLHPFALLMQTPDGLLLAVGSRGQEMVQDADPGTIRVLKAMADASRLRILELIGERPRYVQELADVLDVRHPTVVHHLTLLRQAGLIDSYDEGGTTYYVVRPAMFDDVFAHLRRRLRLHG